MDHVDASRQAAGSPRLALRLTGNTPNVSDVGTCPCGDSPNKDNDALDSKPTCQPLCLGQLKIHNEKCLDV
ncbi:hypothetical protein Lal_00043331 [Lupinus albus]|nr:hypothetical protein Lal_00043331 [Lupinus albus]